MSRFEPAPALAAVASATGAYEAAIGRVAAPGPVARALRAVAVSRAAALAIDVADLAGARLGPQPNGASAWAAGRHEVSLSGDAGAVMASAVLALRRAQQAAYGVRADLPTLGSGDRAVAGVMLDADAAAFLVHVAAEAAAAGMPTLARHVEGSNVYAPVVDAYRRGARKGGARTGAAMAFAAAAADGGFVERWLDGGEDPVGVMARGVATRLSGSSPAGGAYPDRAFQQAFSNLREAVALRVQAAAEADAAAAAETGSSRAMAA